MGWFPVWFFNLPPADPGRQATAADRPPDVTTGLELDGYLEVDRPGEFRLLVGEDVHHTALVDDRPFDAEELSRGIGLETGLHHVAIRGALVNSHWSLTPSWNGAGVWTGAIATLSPPSTIDRWLRPWGRFVTPLAVVVLLIGVVGGIVRRARSPSTLAYVAVLSTVALIVGWTERDPLMRGAPLLILAAVALNPPRRLQNLFGASLLVGLPFMALFLPKAAREAGLFTWYSSGDDWWMFQRAAYRIFMQGYWLEGDEPTFWFQPFYRWIAGALHMVFGDSSVGELLWDSGAALVCALFAFHVTRVFAGFRWGIVAAAVTLSTFTLGPTWYLLGRGLSEYSSAGFIYAAALLTLRARGGYWPAALGAGLFATLGFYTRLNNLPMTVAVAAFALPVLQQVGTIWRPSAWMPRVSRISAAGLLGGVSLGVWLFTARTYYYTGVPSMLYGTSSSANSIWRGIEGPWDLAERLTSSLLTLLTMNDPPRFDVRALAVLVGFGVAVLGVARVRHFARFPLNVSVFCLSGVVGAFVARAPTYPGRFSTHLIPAAVALSVCAVALLTMPRQPKSARPDLPPPGTT